MSAISRALSTLSLTVGLALSGCVSIQPGEPGRSVDGLTRIQSPQHIDSVYVAPGGSLAGYRRVMLDEVEVAFSRDWQKKHPHVPPEEVERIRGEAARTFRDTFSAELAKGGYAMTLAPAPDVLRVAASIVDLDFATSSRAGSDPKKGPYVLSPEGMTLLAELRDSVSGAILVRAADHELGRKIGDLQIANDMSTSAEARAAFEMWAVVLRRALDDANAPSVKTP